MPRHVSGDEQVAEEAGDARAGGFVRTGLRGLDDILEGGLPPGRLYLVHGRPGTGKTTLGLQFLLEGVRNGERTLYVTLIPARDELLEVAESHGWTLDGVDVLELPEQVRDGSAGRQTVFSTADIEMNEIGDAIVEGIRHHRPHRMVLDSVSQLAVLVDNPTQLRSQLLQLKDVLGQQSCTSLFIASETGERLHHLQTLVHGAVELEMATPAYGDVHRSLEVRKVRGKTYSGGRHDSRIARGGLEVYPRLERKRVEQQDRGPTLSSGIQGLDKLLGGGLEEGTVCLIAGTTGAGKSTLASLYVQAAAERGEPSAVFCFDEGRDMYLRRSEALGLAVPEYVRKGLVDLRQIDVGQLPPGELAHSLRRGVEEDHVRLVVLDSLTGYLSAMPERSMLMQQLHQVFCYLNAAGALTLPVVTAHGVFGSAETPIDASYLADTVLLLRHFEAAGHIRRCVAVLKKRYGDHEKTIREFQIVRGGCRIGPPLEAFTGVLTGLPSFTGQAAGLLSRSSDAEPGGGNGG